MDTRRDESRATGSWAAVEVNGGQWWAVKSAARQLCMTTGARAQRDAEDVADAVNQHAALLACRKALERVVTSMDRQMDPMEWAADVRTCDAVIAARAALAASQPKAEG